LSVVVILSVGGYALASRTSAPSSGTRAEAAGHGLEAHDAKSGTNSAGQPGYPADEDLFDDAAIASYLARTTSDITAAVYDTVSGHTSLYRPGVAQDTASIMKVDILATLLTQAQAQDEALTDEQQYLSQEMIEESDDDDAQDLWDAEGGATAVRAFDAQAGLTQTTPDAAGYWGLSTTTAADQIQLLKTVAYPNPLLTNSSRRYELDLMANVDPDQAWGVSSGVGHGATIAIKNGWLPLDGGGWQVNSIGYIHGHGRNYLVAVLSHQATEVAGIDTIEGLSDLIWKALAPTRA
jgi:beta-lactamase class A